MPLAANIPKKDLIMMEINITIIVKSNKLFSGDKSIRGW